MILRIVSREHLNTIENKEEGIRYATVGQGFCGVGFDKIEILSLDYTDYFDEWFRTTVLTRLNPYKRKEKSEDAIGMERRD